MSISIEVRPCPKSSDFAPGSPCVTDHLCKFWGVFLRFHPFAVALATLIAASGCARGGGVDPIEDKRDGGALVTDAGPPSSDSGPSCVRDSDCDDDVLCNGRETCGDDAHCQKGDAPSCADSFECTVDSCDPVTDTCVHLPADDVCSDGASCNGVETCDPARASTATGCLAAAPVVCDDGLSCTTEMCVEPTGTCVTMGSDADGDGAIALGCGAGTDCDDTNSAVHVGLDEVCDGLDNDCSGDADDGTSMTCVRGSSIACTTSCGSSGTRACDETCQLAASCTAAELCNGCDDNSDGTADDGFSCVLGTSVACTTACGTAGARRCAADCSGMLACAAAAEVCNNACDDDGDGRVDNGCPPPGDLCAAPLAITGSRGTRVDTFNYATRQLTDCGAGAEIFYRLNLTAKSIVYLSTFGSNFDTKLSIRSSCTASATQCQDDDCGETQDRLTGVFNAGTYFVAVGAYSAARELGSVSLHWEIAPAATGDNTAITTDGDYVGATAGTGGVAASCGSSAAGPEDAYYFMICPDTLVSLDADTCTAGYDTVLHMRDAIGGLDCNDDGCTSGLGSALSQSLSGEGMFVIYVDTYGTRTGGDYTLNVTRL